MAEQDRAPSFWERYGHLQGENRIPERPWWKRTEGRLDAPFVRENNRVEITAREAFGKGFHELLAMMDEIDRDNPMETPLPAVGQVWRVRRPAQGHPVWMTSGDNVFCEVAVTDVREDTGRERGIVCLLGVDWHTTYDPPFSHPDGMMVNHTYRSWPPRGGVLVAGPGAPWLPPGWSDG